MGFVVQGEGRGHMTQALALAAHLRDAGHDVERVWVGRSPWRTTPGYFVDGIEAPVVPFDAPVQVPDRHGLGASAARTAADALRRAPAFARAAGAIHRGSRDLDVVVNFLDLVGAASRVLLRTPVPAVAVAHNYAFLHSGPTSLPGPAWKRRAVLAWARATASGARTRLALSFAPGAPDDVRPPPAFRLVPPLLRAGLERLRPHEGGHLLAYALNPGYGDRLAAWHRRHPSVRVHCYLDGGRGALRGETAPGFEVHDLDQDRFLAHLAGCRAYVGSAGFESICEAYWLGKPVLAVPTRGQFEQRLNAWDAERHGTARAGDYDGLDAFWAAPPAPEPHRVERFRAWVARAAEVHVDAVERTARER